MLTPELKAFIQGIPKAELHYHLEGSIQPATLLKLAARHEIELPFEDEEGAKKFYKFENLNLDSKEAGNPASRHKVAFDRAKELGFRLVAHAGEDAGSESVWDALSMGVERIDHGVRCFQIFMDLPNIETYISPTDLQAVENWDQGWAQLAGNTWIFSKPEPDLKVLVNLEKLGWFSN